MEIMEVHKRSSKGGSFLSLFDWNGKSRKKLFSENSDRPGMTVNSSFPGSACQFKEYVVILNFDSVVKCLIEESANQGNVSSEILPGSRLLQTVRNLLFLVAHVL